MQDSKPWYQSTTIRGVLISVLGLLLRAVLPDFEINDVEVTSVVSPVLEGLGAVIAVIGRVKAKTSVTLSNG
jgi:hypothetical protein